MGRQATLTLSLLLLAETISASDFRNQWQDRYQQDHSRGDLEAILDENKQWFASEGEHGRPADLAGADLSRLDIDKLDFSGALLLDAAFDGSNLKHSIFTGADLHKASFQDALLQMSVLRNTFAFGADFSRAKLWGADFSGADLSHAIFTDSELDEAVLTEASMWQARLDGAWYDASAPPRIPTIATALGLGELRYRYPPGLIQLRNGFRDAGFDYQARVITYVIHHGALRHDFKSFVKLALFEWPARWGQAKWRPLKIIGTLIAIGALLNLFALLGNGRDARAGIYKDWSESKDPRRPKRVGADKKPAIAELERLSFKELRKQTTRLRAIWLIGVFSVYFSLLSAFQIGWMRVSVSTWLARVQHSDFGLFAMGWVKVISGLQSILCLYFFALWLAVFFGQPFG